MNIGPDLQTLSLCFLAIVVGLVFILRIGFARGGLPFRKVLWVQICIALWLGTVGFLGVRGFFSDFSGIPPRLLLALLPVVALLVFFAVSKKAKPYLLLFPKNWAIGLQTFRLPMELILRGLFLKGVMPEIMTFSGRNFDILIGLTAPLIALLKLKEPILQAKIQIAWNGLGLILLTNVMLNGLLSAPTALQFFQVEPANTLVGSFPFIWLPLFVVPVAYFLHIVSIKQLIMASSVEYEPPVTAD